MILHCFQLGEKEGVGGYTGYRPLSKSKGKHGRYPPIGNQRVAKGYLFSTLWNQRGWDIRGPPTPSFEIKEMRGRPVLLGSQRLWVPTGVLSLIFGNQTGWD